MTGKIFFRKPQKPIDISPSVCYNNRARCGCSSSVERQLPKLNRRVRLPSSAPKESPGRNTARVFFCCEWGSWRQIIPKKRMPASYRVTQCAPCVTPPLCVLRAEGANASFIPDAKRSRRRTQKHQMCFAAVISYFFPTLSFLSLTESVVLCYYYTQYQGFLNRNRKGAFFYGNLYHRTVQNLQ